MTTTIKLKNSVTTTNAPISLQQGEVAINVTDKKVWVGNAATTPVQLLGDGGSGSFTTVNTTNLEVTNIKAKDGTASASIANSTGIFTHSTATVFTAGTVSAPAITTTGDTNTGIFFPAADTIAFTEGGVESMRIDSSGNVGIGQTSLSERFTVYSASGNARALIASGANQLYVGWDAGAAVAENATNGAWRVRTGGGFTEAMRIDSSGNVLVNRTSTFSTPGGDTPKIYSAGALGVISGSTVSAYSSDRINFNASTYFVLGSSTGGGVKLDNGTTAWAAQSDETTKDIIEPISNAINKVDSLRAVIGKYKEDVEGTRRSFLIAQDVQAVLPEAVSTSSDGLLSLRYTEVIPLLVASIKEQQALIETLTNRLNALEGK
jgi:hypothetical protein